MASGKKDKNIMTNNVIHEILKVQIKKRHKNPSTPAIKINLYNALEVKAVAQAIQNLNGYCGFVTPDCFMLGDSLLTTHMRRESTRLATLEDQDQFIKTMLKSADEVRNAINECFIKEARPYFMCDLPDGSSVSEYRLLLVTEMMIEHGADMVKLEIANKNDLASLEYLTRKNIPVAAHLGYAPQKNINRQYGKTLNETLELLKLVKLARECGASVLILERVAEVVNRILSKPSRNGLPIYSIFSGKSPGCGQSLNVWDSVYKPPFKALFFPPTADLNIDTYPGSYTYDHIVVCFEKLLKLTLNGDFPKSPSSSLSTNDISFLESLDPWTYNFETTASV
jgi:ketopantoate hydroxymethyltransferase